MKVRVLVIDDSAAMRRLIGVMLHADDEIEVVGEAANAMEARQALITLEPDVATLDMEMPGVGGLELLDEIMRRRPLPVVVVAAKPKPEVRARALAYGAFDVLEKPGSHSTNGRDFSLLVQRVKAAARQGVCRRPTAAPTPPPPARSFAETRHVVGIGGSAGAIEALEELVARLPADCPPILVVQHIPPNFITPLAERLGKLSAASVSVAEDGAVLERGKVYLAPGDRHLSLHKRAPGWRCRLELGESVNGFRPSIDVLFDSIARAAGPGAVGVILSGLGRDGVGGLKAIRQAGGRTLGQDEATSVVYGMPKAAQEAGAVERQASPERLADHILRLCGFEQREAG